jgi:crotonobetainyl-CoA:carnitine CoA-transferase CaiB-like acyl-CoA transferase
LNVAKESRPPLPGRLLAELGADVIKGESPQGDITRLGGPFRGDLPHLENSGVSTGEKIPQ